MHDERQGFFLLWRRFFDSWLWKEERTFSRAEAFLSLLEKAQFKASQIIWNDRFLNLEVGDVLTSMQKLSREWSWSVWKVKRFLEVLQNDGAITYINRTKYTLISISNYSEYQLKGTDYQTVTENRPKTDRKQTETYNECKKNAGKNEKESKEKTVGFADGTPEEKDMSNYVWEVFEYWNEKTGDVYVVKTTAQGKIPGPVANSIKRAVNERGLEKVKKCLDVYFKMRDNPKYWIDAMPIIQVLGYLNMERLDPDNRPFELLKSWKGGKGNGSRKRSENIPPRLQ